MNKNHWLVALLRKIFTATSRCTSSLRNQNLPYFPMNSSNFKLQVSIWFLVAYSKRNCPIECNGIKNARRFDQARESAATDTENELRKIAHS